MARIASSSKNRSGPEALGAEAAGAVNASAWTGAGGDASGAETDRTGSATGSAAGSAESSPPDTEAHRAEADKLNEDGKTKFRTADLNGAIALFQQANQLAPDPRYVFNICLAYEALQQWPQATASCQQAKTMSPSPTPELQAKIDHRLDLLAHKQ